MKRFILLFLCAFIATNGICGDYEYMRSNGEALAIKLINEAGKQRVVFIDGHVAYGGEMRASPNYFIEVDSEFFIFALPHKVDEKEEWVYRDISFKVERKVSVTYKDVKEYLYSISLTLKNSKNIEWLLYCETRGVVSFSRSVVEDVYSFSTNKYEESLVSEVYWLTSELGLAKLRR